jgi:hypothetical protein
MMGKTTPPCKKCPRWLEGSRNRRPELRCFWASSRGATNNLRLSISCRSHDQEITVSTHFLWFIAACFRLLRVGFIASNTSTITCTRKYDDWST